MVYLYAIEEVEELNLGNVYASGGQDTKMREAEANAKIYFRLPQGDPAAGEKAKPWNCAFDSNGARTCSAHYADTLRKLLTYGD